MDGGRDGVVHKECSGGDSDGHICVHDGSGRGRVHNKEDIVGLSGRRTEKHP